MAHDLVWMTTNYDLFKRGRGFDIGRRFPEKFGEYFRVDFLEEAVSSPSISLLTEKLEQETRTPLFPCLELHRELIRVHPDPNVSGIRLIMENPHMDIPTLRSLILGTHPDVAGSHRKYGEGFTHFKVVLDFTSNAGYYAPHHEHIEQDPDFKVRNIEAMRELDVPGY